MLLVDSIVQLDGLNITDPATDTAFLSYTVETTTNKLEYTYRVSSNLGVQNSYLVSSSDPYDMITQTATASISPTAVLSREEIVTIEIRKTTSMFVARCCTLHQQSTIVQ